MKNTFKDQVITWSLDHSKTYLNNEFFEKVKSLKRNDWYELYKLFNNVYTVDIDIQHFFNKRGFDLLNKVDNMYIQNFIIRREQLMVWIVTVEVYGTVDIGGFYPYEERHEIKCIDEKTAIDLIHRLERFKKSVIEYKEKTKRNKNILFLSENRVVRYTTDRLYENFQLWFNGEFLNMKFE